MGAACGGQFSDGKPLQALIDALVEDPTYALNDDRLIVDVVKKGRALMCVDNRRLHCFHEADKLIAPVKKVLIRIRQHTWRPIWDRFSKNLDPENHGKHIRVRPPQR